jgi:hypothetical protein
MQPYRRNLALAAIVLTAAALSTMPPAQAQSPQGGEMPMGQHMHGAHMPGTAEPQLPGQDAFGALQEIVAILEADPKTDWSKVNLEALRQHLIDMNEVVLHADADAKPVDGGLAIAITGGGRTLLAIQRMIPAQGQMLNGHDNWSTKVEALPSGELLTVTASDPREVQHIRGLGFAGILASGSYHQMHHLAMARGEFMH